MAVTSAFQPFIPNRRRRVRHRIQTPAYASFSAESNGATLDLHEIINLSEDGVAIQCNASLEINRRVNICLDLAECESEIFTTGKVVWSKGSGLTGLNFCDLSPVSLFRLREWLFLNAMAGAANADDSALAASSVELHIPATPNFTDTLAAVTAVQRQVEALGSDLPAALKLIADRAQSLVRASGCAIALAASDPELANPENADSETMECQASSGRLAPPVGAHLQVGEGFSGECVKSGRLLRCDDTELDLRVDRERCRDLGLRSILAVPVRSGEKSVGLIETLSEEPSTFTDNDGIVLQRFAETIIAAVNRAAVNRTAVNRAENLSSPDSPLVERFAPQGSVLFASEPNSKKTESNKNKEEEKTDEAADPNCNSEDKKSGRIHLPRSLLLLLLGCAMAIPLALGYLAAPLIQAKIKEHGHPSLPTVLASSPVLRPEESSVETATFSQLKQMAEDGNAAAENALGLRYFQGDEKDNVAPDEREAVRWFNKSAVHGNLAAQAKLGSLYWSGRGVAKDVNQAYFWTVLARARGDEHNRDLASILASGMTRSQTAAIEQQANVWLQQHLPTWKPSAGRSAGN
jgi:hypothetical protein